MNLRNRKHVLIALAVAAVAMFLGGGVAAYVSRHDHICAGGKLPLKKRSDILGQTQFLCPGGTTVSR